jgi:type 1 glutamine amidotransferase
MHTEAHDAGERTVPAALRERGHTVDVTNDVGMFTDATLAPYDVIVFFVTSGRVLTEPTQRNALLTFIHAGKGVAGAHTANATDLDWIDDSGRFIMDSMWGSSFYGHGAGDVARSEAGLIPDNTSPLTSFLPSPWLRYDEWYFYFTNPMGRPSLDPLIMLDESYITPYAGDGSTRPEGWYPDIGIYGDAGHPISWTKDFECARVFYTAMGHTGSAWEEELVIRHFVAGIEWAGAPASEL